MSPLRGFSDPSLSRTPIGVVTYRRLRNGEVVAMAARRGCKRPRIIHSHEERGTIWDALYGKAPLEAPRHNAVMARKRYEAERAAMRAKANASTAFRADAGWIFRRHPDLARMIAASRPRSA
jgi:hypothetical protein